MQLFWIVGLLFAILIALFAVQNTTTVTVNVLFWQLENVAVSTLILASAALGALVTWIFGLGRDIRQRVQLRSSRGTVRDQEKLIAELRDQVRELERENERYRAAVERQEQAAGPQQQTVASPAQTVPDA